MSDVLINIHTVGGEFTFPISRNQNGSFECPTCSEKFTDKARVLSHRHFVQLAETALLGSSYHTDEAGPDPSAGGRPSPPVSSHAGLRRELPPAMIDQRQTRKKSDKGPDNEELPQASSEVRISSIPLTNADGTTTISIFPLLRVPLDRPFDTAKQKYQRRTLFSCGEGKVTWGDGRDTCDHSSGICAAASFFGVEYSASCRALLNPLEQVVLPATDLDKFLQRKIRQEAASIDVAFTKDELLIHILEAFDINKNQTPENIGEYLRDHELNEPISQLPTPVKAWQCKECFGWFTVMFAAYPNRKSGKRNLYKHWEAQCGRGQPPDPSPRLAWTIPLFKNGFHVPIRAVLIESWAPDRAIRARAAAIPVPSLPNTKESFRREKLVYPTWFEKAGFKEVMENLNPLVARQLARSPTLALADSYPRGSDEWALEHVNLAIRTLCFEILDEAEKKALEKSYRIREQLTEGTKSHFRALTQKTLGAYSAELGRLLSACTRWATLHGTPEEVDLYFAFTEEQLDIIEQIIVEHVAVDNFDPANVDKRGLKKSLMRFLESVLTMEVETSEKISCCIVTYLALFSIHTDEGVIRPASNITGACARLQRALLSAHLEAGIHSSADGISKDALVEIFELVSKAAQNYTESDTNEDEDEDDNEDEDEDDNEDKSDDTAIDLDELEGNSPSLLKVRGATSLKQRLQSGNLFGKERGVLSRNKGQAKNRTKSYFAENAEVIDPKGRFAMGALKHIWLCASQGAKAERGHTTTIWDGFDKFWFGYRNRKSIIHIQPLFDICRQETESMIAAFKAIPGFVKFDFTKVMDSPTEDTSIVNHADNAKIFGPLVEELQKSLISSLVDGKGVINKEAVYKKLVEFELLNWSVARVFPLTSGITARSWQICRLIYDSFEGKSRCVKILAPGLVIVCDLEAKSYTKLQKEDPYRAVYALSPQLAACMLFLIGVLRPIELKLLHMTQHTTDMVELQHYVFASAARRYRNLADCFLDADELNYQMSQTVGLSIPECRQVFIAIYRKYFPTLMNSVDSIKLSPVDRQSQHTAKVAYSWYALDGMMQAVGMAENECLAAILVSQVAHYMMRIIGTPPFGFSHAISHDINDPSVILNRSKHQALSSVEKIYLNSIHASPSLIRETVVQMFTKSPFMLRPGAAMGDDVLISVIAEYIYGAAMPNHLSSPPIITPEVVRDSIILIMQALFSWQTGEYQPVQDDLIIGEVTQLLDTDIEAVRLGYADSWNALQAKVLTYALERRDSGHGRGKHSSDLLQTFLQSIRVSASAGSESYAQHNPRKVLSPMEVVKRIESKKAKDKKKADSSPESSPLFTDDDDDDDDDEGYEDNDDGDADDDDDNDNDNSDKE